MTAHRITLDRAEYDALMQRVGDAEERASRAMARERELDEREARVRSLEIRAQEDREARDRAEANVVSVNELVQGHIDRLRELAWEHARAQFTTAPGWTSADECVSMLVNEIMGARAVAKSREAVLERIEKALGDACTGDLAADVERVVEICPDPDEPTRGRDVDVGDEEDGEP